MIASKLAVIATASTTAVLCWRVAVLCLLNATFIHGFSPCQLHAQSDVQSVIDQIDFERQKLISGEFRCDMEQWEGRRDRTEDSDPELAKQASWSAECTFDYLAQSAVIAVVHEMHDQTEFGSTHIRPGSRYVAAYVGDVFQFTNLEKTPIWLHLEERTVPQRVPRYGMTPIDPRAVGLTTASKLLRGFDLAHSLEALDLNALSVAERLKPTPLKIERSESGDSHIQLSQVYQRGIVRKTVVVDPESDFIVRRFFTEYGSYDAESEIFEPRSYSYTCDITWEQSGGTWIPVRLLANHYENEIADGVAEGEVPVDAPGSVFVKTTRTDYRLNWGAVNEPVDPEVFQYANFGLPVGSLVADFRLPEPEIVDRIVSDSRISRPMTGLARALMLLAAACLGIGAFRLFQLRSRRTESR